MNLHEKLIAIRKGVTYLQKTSKNSQQGFQYTSSSQVLASVRALMDEHKVLLISAVLGGKLHPKGNGNKMNTTELNMSMNWVDAENPKDNIMVPWYGQGCDQHEKGVGKALTYAEKYFILKQFNIATDKDDPDAFVERYSQTPDEPISVDQATEICDLLRTVGSRLGKVLEMGRGGRS
jgi:hypothetical protein